MSTKRRVPAIKWPRMVAVCWESCEFDTDSTGLFANEITAQYAPRMLVNIGFLVHRDKRVIILASEIEESSPNQGRPGELLWRDLMHIPAHSVRGIRGLRDFK